MSEDFLVTEWKDINRKIDGDREAGDGTDVVLGLQHTSSPVILKPPLPSTVQQPYQNRRKNIGGQDLQGVSPNGEVAFHSTTETSKLLDLTSSSSSESDLNLQIVPPKRKVRFKRKLRPLQKSGKNKNGIPCRDENVGSSQGCCCCTGGEGLGGLAFVLVFCALGTLMWFHYGLSSRLDTLQKQYNNMEAQSKETPEALHDYHIQLKGLESNVTAFGQDLKRINTEILSLHDAVKQLKEVSADLRESIAAAPEIKTLPKDVISITESVATFGSKISELQSNVEDLKKGQRQLTDSERELKTEHQQIKGTLANLSVQKDSATHDDTQNLRNSLTDYFHQELVHMATTVDELNQTIGARLQEVDKHLSEANESLNWVANDMAQLHVFVYQNLSSTSGAKAMDPVLLGSALQQETQHMLHEVLVNVSAVHSTEVPLSQSPPGSEWKDVLAHAHQVSLAYWALLKDLSLTFGDIQESSAIPEAVLTKAVSQLTVNTTAALKSMNASLSALSLRTEKLESFHHGSESPFSTTVATPILELSIAKSPLTNDTLQPQQQQSQSSARIHEALGQPVKEPVPQNPPSTSSNSSSSSGSSSSFSQENLGEAMPTAIPTSAPTVPSLLLRKIRPQLSITEEKMNNRHGSESISSDIENIP